MKGEYPYDNYKIEDAFLNQQGRYCMHVTDESGKRKQILRSRYVMSIHVGRFLQTNEHVHHKDEDKSNDDILNLEILSPQDHNRLHKTGKTYIDCVCDHCENEFELQLKDFTQRIKKGKIFCSVGCARKYGKITILNCSFCSKGFEIINGRLNEAKKRGTVNFFCSKSCRDSISPRKRGRIKINSKPRLFR